MCCVLGRGAALAHLALSAPRFIIVYNITHFSSCEAPPLEVPSLEVIHQVLERSRSVPRPHPPIARCHAHRHALNTAGAVLMAVSEGSSDGLAGGTCRGGGSSRSAIVFPQLLYLPLPPQPKKEKTPAKPAKPPGGVDIRAFFKPKTAPGVPWRRSTRRLPPSSTPQPADRQPCLDASQRVPYTLPCSTQAGGRAEAGRCEAGGGGSKAPGCSRSACRPCRLSRARRRRRRWPQPPLCQARAHARQRRCRQQEPLGSACRQA